MSDESGSSGVGAIITLLVLAFIGVFLWSSIIVPGWEKYIVKVDQPWWTGTATQKVCEIGPGNCYMLDVRNVDNQILTIYFPSGGYVEIEVFCEKAASGVGYDFDRFCSGQDEEGRNWEVRRQI